MRYYSLLLAFLISVSASAIIHTSVTDGNVTNPATWDCACIPTADDDLVINHDITTNIIDTVSNVTVNSGGALIVTNGPFKIFGDFTIMSGGLVTQDWRTEVRGDYSLFGTHTGTAEFVFRTSGTIYGNGTFTKTGLIRFITETRTIDASADLDLSSSSLFLKNDASIDNFGIVRASSMKSIGSTTFWRNRSGATLYVSSTTNTNVKMQAHYDDNLVVFNSMGAGEQVIVPAQTSFYNLTLLGASSAAEKRFINDIVVLNDLIMQDCTVDPQIDLYVRNFTVGGDWSEVNAVFLRRTSNVTFGSGSHSLSTTDSFLSFHDLTLEGATTLNKPIQTLGLLSLDGELDMNGFLVQVAGSWDSSETGLLIYSDEQVLFRGSSNAVVSGTTEFGNVVINKPGTSQVNVIGTMAIKGTLLLNSGLLNSNGNVIIASDAEGTGRLGVVGNGTIGGDLVVERYTNFASNDWHLLGSSVTGMTVGDWSGDFITTGYPGSDFPTNSFNSVTRYDEATVGDRDEGFVGVSADTEAIAPGDGRRVYLAAGENQISVAGPPITGPFNWNLSYTNTGEAESDGWNLICNPYPSTIDWDDVANWNKVNVNDAIYVWGGEDGTYTSYISGVGVNGGSPFIPSSQAFWVQTNGGGPSLSITENAKSNQDQEFKSKAPQFFKIRMTTSNAKQDEVAVRVHQEATSGFDRNFDAYEFKSHDQLYPSIALRATDNIDLSIYSLSEFYESTIIPMPIYVSSTGEVDFSLVDEEGFPAGQIQLYDSIEDEYHNMLQSKKVTLSLDQGDYEDRFFLVMNETVGAPVSDVKSIGQKTPVLKVWGDEQQILIDFNADFSMTADLTILNSLGQIVYKEANLPLDGIKSIDASDLNGVLLIQLENQLNGERYTQRIVR